MRLGSVQYKWDYKAHFWRSESAESQGNIYVRIYFKVTDFYVLIKHDHDIIVVKYININQSLRHISWLTLTTFFLFASLSRRSTAWSGARCVNHPVHNSLPSRSRKPAFDANLQYVGCCHGNENKRPYQVYSKGVPQQVDGIFEQNLQYWDQGKP